MDIQCMINNMYVSVDWLAFTVDTEKPFGVIHQLGFEPGDFKIMPRGARGYKQHLKCKKCECSILYDGNDDMGIHVEIKGSAFPILYNVFFSRHSQQTPFGIAYDTPFDMHHMSYFLKVITDMAKNISRCDLAIDDIGQNYFSVEDIYNLIKERRCVTRFKSYSNISKGSFSNNETIGNTLYFGSRKSEIFIRVYDKKLEQNIETDWVRWEMELKNENAITALKEVVRLNDLAKVTLGILSNYVKFINLDNLNRSRCSLNEKWLEFLHASQKISLFNSSTKKGIEEKKDWVDRQVGPTIAQILQYDGGSLEFFLDNLSQWSLRGGIPLDD